LLLRLWRFNRRIHRRSFTPLRASPMRRPFN